MKKQVSRYKNRKLYDHEETGYVTLQELGDHVREGGDFTVTDKTTKVQHDTTPNVMMSIIEQNEQAAMSRRPEPFRPISMELMNRIIVSGGLTQYAQQLEARMPS